MSKLPPAKEIETTVAALIEKYRGVVPDTNNYQEILDDVRTSLGAIGTATETREFEQWYFRVRPSVANETNPTEFGAPPAKYTKSHGRCNLEGHPVFYGGEQLGIAILEANVKPGETAYLSLWRSRNNFPRYTMYGFTENVESERLQFYVNTRMDTFRKSLRGRPKDVIESFSALQQAMADLFTCDSWAISAALSHWQIYENEMDGVEYPDTKNRQTYNFALNPNFAEKLELWRVWFCRATDDFRRVDFARVGRPVGGKIAWSNCSSDEDFPDKTPDVNLTLIMDKNWKPPK